MQNLRYLLAIAGLIFLFSCNQGRQSPAAVNNTSRLKPGRHCYTALFEKDSASLSFNITANGKISGQLAIIYFKTDTILAAREPATGNIIGEFRGDTLFADYNLKSGAKGKTSYINPIALLHKGDTLIMGKGIIYYYLGRTYFDDKTPINFKKSRFRFMPVNCK